MSSEMEKQLAKMKENYVASLPDKFGAIRSLWVQVSVDKNHDGIAEIHRMAHSLSGSGATFDQLVVSEKAKILENYLKENSAEAGIFEGEHVDAVDDHLKNLEATIAA